MTDTPRRSPFQTSTADYYSALGEFIHTFAEVEVQLQYALWSEAGVSPEVARAIFSGVKIDLGKSYIVRLMDALGRPRNPLLERGFAQLTVLTTARNDIVHYGAKFEAGRMHASTELVAHTPQKVRITPLSKDILRAMIADLIHIKWILILHIMRRQPTPDGYKDWVTEAAEQPWQYKPPQQSPPRKPPREPRPKQRPRRGASQA